MASLGSYYSTPQPNARCLSTRKKIANARKVRKRNANLRQQFSDVRLLTYVVYLTCSCLATHDATQEPTSVLIIDHSTASGLCLRALVDLAASPRPSEFNAFCDLCNAFTSPRRAEKYEPPIAAQVGKPAILALKLRRNASYYRNGHPPSFALNTTISW